MDELRVRFTNIFFMKNANIQEKFLHSCLNSVKVDTKNIIHIPTSMLTWHMEKLLSDFMDRNWSAGNGIFLLK